MNDIHLGCAIQFIQKEQVENDKKDAFEPSAHPFIPRGDSFGRDTVLESDLSTCPALESESSTLLFVRFLERGSGKCRDREAFG